MDKVVKVGELKGGQWFREAHGEHPYLVISLSAARYHGLPEGRVYSLSLETGTMAAFDPEAEVVLVSWKPSVA